MAIGSLFGIDTNAGDNELKQAIAALQAVGVPTAEQLKLPELQKYVSAGVLSPEQYQAIIANPDIYAQTVAENQDNSGSDAQKAALQQLGSIVNAGGSSAINQANLKNNLSQVNQAMQAARAGITNDAQQRNVSGNGLEFIAKLMNEQSGAENANMAATNSAADNAKLALQALTQQGQLGGQMQSNANQMAQAQAEAARQIAEYNSTLRSQANQYNTEQANNAMTANLANAQDISNQNTGLSNYRTQYNAQVPQTLFEDQMKKAGGIADAYVKNSENEQKQAGQNAAMTGNLLGTAANVYGSYLGSKKPAAPKTGYADGGVIRPGGDVVRNSVGTPAPQSHKSGGVPKEALMALAGVMAAYPMLRYAFGNSEPDQTTLQQDMGAQKGMGEDPAGMCHGGMCYAQGGEVHDHRLCMKAGGTVPGDDSDMPPMVDDESQDVVPANLSPNEIVLPRSVSMAPNAPERAEQFVSQIKGMPQMSSDVNSFSDLLSKLEENGLELRLASRG